MPAPPPSPPPEDGSTLVELLISLALMVLLIGAVAVILPRSMQLTRSDTLTAATNINLTGLVQDFTTSLERSRPVILTAASRTRLDVLQLGDPITLNVPGQLTDGLSDVVMNADLDASDNGAELVFLNNQGDYLINTITNITRTAEGNNVSLKCPLNLPGVLRAYPFTRLSYAFASSTGLAEPQQALYRFEQPSALTGQKVTATWTPLIGAQNAQFAPVYGQTSGDFGTTLKAPTPSMTIAGQFQPLTSINYAITALDNGHPVTNAGAASIRMAGTKAWACGQNVGRPRADTGTLQVNTTLEGKYRNIPGNPQVTVVGPTSTTQINTFAVRVFPKMMPGTYSASAQILNANGTSYDPHITGNPGTVGGQQSATISVDYREAPGTLQIIEDGLPAERAAMINGSKLYSAKSPVRGLIDITALSSQILPGTYTLTSSTPTITVNGQTFTTTPISVTITARKVTTVHVQWKPATGTALIHIQGLPANEKATFQFYTPSPYYLKDFYSPNGDVTIGQLQRGNYGLFAFYTPSGYIAKVTWTLGATSGTGDGDTGTGIPIEPGQTTLVSVNYMLSSSSTPGGNTGDGFLVWGDVGRTLPNGIVHIRPGLEDHLNPSPAPMTTYVMSNLDAVRLSAGWYTIIVTDAATNVLYRVVTFVGSSPAFAISDIGPEYTVQGVPMPYLNTVYVGDSTKGNLVFYATEELDRPLKTSITTPNDGVVHTTLDQGLLQYVGSFGISDGATGVLWKLQNQGLHVDYENYQPIKNSLNTGGQTPVTQHNFCSRSKTGTTFQDCLSDYVRYGTWW